MESSACGNCGKEFNRIQPEGRFRCAACGREFCFWCAKKNLYNSGLHVCSGCFPKWTSEAVSRDFCEINEYGQQNWKLDDDSRRRELEKWIGGLKKK